MVLRNRFNDLFMLLFFFSSRRRHTRCGRDWSSDVCSSDLPLQVRRDEQRQPGASLQCVELGGDVEGGADGDDRSEEHTSELQSRPHLVCRLLLEKKKN